MPKAINFSFAAATSVPPMNTASIGFLLRHGGRRAELLRQLQRLGHVLRCDDDHDGVNRFVLLHHFERFHIAVGGASPMTSIGLPNAPAAGMKARNFVSLSLLGETIFKPDDSAASAAMMPGPPALVMMATRSPFGSGCMANAVA